MFLIYTDKITRNTRNSVRIIIIAHGISTATSMADAVNGLLGTQYAKGINAPIEEKPQVILEKTKDYIRQNDIHSDILFLVDMGSLTTFGKEIENEFKLKTKTITLVSTLHCIEATRKAIIGYTLDEIYKGTLEVNNLYDNNAIEHMPETREKRKLAIITICTTGEGGAKTLKRILERTLKFETSLLDIVPVNLIGTESIYGRLEKLSNRYEIICLVSSFELEVNYPQFRLDDVIEGTSIENIQDLIDRERTYIKIEETLDHQLNNVDGKTVLVEIKKFCRTVSKTLNIKLTSNALIGITLHMACMIDRLCGNEELVEEYPEKEVYIKENLELYRIIKSQCMLLNVNYAILISEDEMCFLINLFNMKSRKK